MDTKKLIIAVVLSMAVIFIFGIFIPSRFGNKSEKEKKEQAEEGKGEPEPGDGQTAGKAASVEGDQPKVEAEDPTGKQTEGEEAPAAGETTLRPDYPDQTFTLASAMVEALFSSKGARIVELKLLDPHYAEKSGTKYDIVRKHPTTGEPLALLSFKADSGSVSIPEDLPYRLLEKDNKTLVFVSDYGPWNIKRRFRMIDDYTINAATTVTNTSDDALPIRPVYAVRTYKKEKKATGVLSWLNPSTDIPEGICSLAGETDRKDINKLRKENLSRAGRIDFAAVADLYFLSAMIPLTGKKGKKGAGGFGEAGLSGDEASSYGCKAWADDEGVITSELFRGESKLHRNESSSIRVTSYLGPKEFNRLSAFGHELKSAINFGWFGWLSIMFLHVLTAFQKVVRNWGLAIILLTLVIKLILLPLTHWSFSSMRNMSAIKPLIDEINKKYSAPEDREKKNQAMLELYKTHKINPMMGCLPMLLQMPIWIALYRMLAMCVELYHTPFILWIDDLSQRDPYFILPVALGASMFVQQKLTPTTTDSQQAKMMMYFMPLMFMGFMLFLPAGLNLYILVSTVLTIVQQKLLYKPKVATVDDRKVRIMADMDQKEVGSLKKRGKGKGKGKGN
ncbi:MAG: membrane protein insertase YidC [Pseudomonadota bacterium]